MRSTQRKDANKRLQRRGRAGRLVVTWTGSKRQDGRRETGDKRAHSSFHSIPHPSSKRAATTATSAAGGTRGAAAAPTMGSLLSVTLSLTCSRSREQGVEIVTHARNPPHAAQPPGV